MDKLVDTTFCELDAYTGRVDYEHMLALHFGINFIVFVLDDGTTFAIGDIPANQQRIEDIQNNHPKLAEWTRVRAYDGEDAKAHAIAAHNQFYDKLNGLDDWVNSAELGMRTV